MTRESVTDVMRKAADFLPAQLSEEMVKAIATVTELMEAAAKARGFGLPHPSSTHAVYMPPASQLRHKANLIEEEERDRNRLNVALTACKGQDQTDEH